jgi:uncharacterized protein (DUF2267 family)
MADKGLKGIDETLQQTYIWINEVAEHFHGDRHQGLQILRAFLHLVRDHLLTDELAQLAAQLPMLVRGVYYEGWNPSHSLRHERDAQAFLDRFVSESGVRAMDSRDAVKAASSVLKRHVSGGEYAQVVEALPAHLRELVA